MLSAINDIGIYILKAKVEEKLERGETKITQFVKLELNLKSFFYSFHLGIIKRIYGTRIKNQLQKKSTSLNHKVCYIFFFKSLNCLFTIFSCQYLGIDYNI